MAAIVGVLFIIAILIGLPLMTIGELSGSDPAYYAGGWIFFGGIGVILILAVYSVWEAVLT